MTDPNKPTTVVTQPGAGGQQVVTGVLPHGTKPVSVAQVAAADPQSANALLQATHMLDPLMGFVGGAANPAMTAMQSAIAHRGAESAVETPQMPTTLKEHGKMTFVDAPKQHATAQFEAPAAPLTTKAPSGAAAAKPPAEAALTGEKAEVHPQQQTAPAAGGTADDGAAGAQNGGHKRKHSEATAAANTADKGKADASSPAGEKAQTLAASATANTADTATAKGEEGETAAKSTRS